MKRAKVSQALFAKVAANKSQVRSAALPSDHQKGVYGSGLNQSERSRNVRLRNNAAITDHVTSLT